MLKSAPVRSGKISSWLGQVVAAAAWALALALLTSDGARARPEARGDRRAASAGPAARSCACARTARRLSRWPSRSRTQRASRSTCRTPRSVCQSPPRRERGATHLDSCGRGQRPHAHRLQPEQHGAVPDARRRRQRLRDARPSSGRRAAAVVRGTARAERGARRRAPLAAQAAQRSIRNIDFRRGTDGAGQVVVELNDPHTTVDVREEGGRVVVDFQDTAIPNDLMKRLDVTDFATPVLTVDALRANRNARLVVSAADRVRPSRIPDRQPVHSRAQAAGAEGRRGDLGRLQPEP